MRRSPSERVAALYARLQESAYAREQRAAADRLAELRARDRAELRAAPREARAEVQRRIERRDNERLHARAVKLGTAPVPVPGPTSKRASEGVRFPGAEEAASIASVPGQARLSAEARMAARDWAPKLGDAVFRSPRNGRVWWEVSAPEAAERWVGYLMEREPDGTVSVLGLTPMSRTKQEAIENTADLATMEGYGAKRGGERFILAVPVSRGPEFVPSWDR